MAAKIKLNDLKKKTAKKKVSKKKTTKKKVAAKTRTTSYTPDENLTKVDPPPKTDVMTVHEMRADVAAHHLIDMNFRERDAYEATFGCTKKQARSECARYFRKPYVIKAVKRVLFGDLAADEVEGAGKEWAIERWQEQLNISPLDYFDDEGKVLPVKELKKLPAWFRRNLTGITSTRTEVPVTHNGEEVMDDEGKPLVIVTDNVSITMVSKEKALENIAKCLKWIQSHNVNVDITVGMDALRESMAAADSRAARAPRVIEGKFEEVKDV